jgi:hypothetical protein
MEMVLWYFQSGEITYTQILACLRQNKRHTVTYRNKWSRINTRWRWSKLHTRSNQPFTQRNQTNGSWKFTRKKQKFTQRRQKFTQRRHKFTRRSELRNLIHTKKWEDKIHTIHTKSKWEAMRCELRNSIHTKKWEAIRGVPDIRYAGLSGRISAKNEYPVSGYLVFLNARFFADFC